MINDHHDNNDHPNHPPTSTPCCCRRVQRLRAVFAPTPFLALFFTPSSLGLVARGIPTDFVDALLHQILSLANRILAAVAVDRFIFLQLAGRTAVTEFPQISGSGIPAVPVTIRDFEPSLRNVREFHLPTVSSQFTAEEKATNSLRRLTMKLPGYVRHVTDRPAGNLYEDLISEIIAGKRSIEALRSVVQTNWRLHRRAFHIPAIPREDSDETPLSPGPHGRRNSGNFLSLFGHRKLHESHGTASEGVSLDRSGSFAQEFFEFLEDRLSREFHSATLRVEATEETPWVLLQSSREFHLLIARVSRGTLFLDASWNSGPGLPLMRLYNELLNRRLLNRWHRRHLRQLGDATDVQTLRQTLRRAVTRVTQTYVVALQTPLRAMTMAGNGFEILAEWREMQGVSLHGEGKWDMERCGM